VYLASYTLCHKNFEVKCAWTRAVLGWVLSLKVLCTPIHIEVCDQPHKNHYASQLTCKYTTSGGPWVDGLFSMIWFLRVTNCSLMSGVQEYICDINMVSSSRAIVKITRFLLPNSYQPNKSLIKLNWIAPNIQWIS